MPIFKVTMTEETSKTFVAYVDAPTKEKADHWASMVEDAATAGRCVREQSDWGSVEDIEPVDTAPAGWPVGTST